MGSRYLTDLANVVRGAGLPCKEYGGWQSRARGSGGYDSGRPNHVMVHHTASSSSWDGQKDADYIAEGADVAPISNLYIDRTGLVWVIAAGATNTNGEGSDWWGGGVPRDSMNSYAIGIEAGNNGVGEVWPTALLKSYRILVNTLCSKYNIPNHNVRGHWEWAEGRKIDPAGNSPYASGGASWNMDKFRSDCLNTSPLPEPEEPVTSEEMDQIAWRVWSLVLGGSSASNLLQRAASAYQPAVDAPAKTINFKVPVGQAQQDFWSVVVDSYFRIQNIQARLTELENNAGSG